MTHIFIGCNRVVGRRDAYFNKLSALEVTETFDNALTPQQLGRMRTESRKGFAFTMQSISALTDGVASEDELPESLRGRFPLSAFGLLQTTEATEAAWDHTLTLAAQLSPKLILLKTPSAFTPTPRNIESLKWFAREQAPKARKAAKAMVAWQPHGLWDPYEVVALSRELGLVPVYDPFVEDDIPAGRGTAYFVLHQRRGLRSRFDDFDMEELLDRCEPYQRAILIFRGTEHYRDARLAYSVWKRRAEEDAFDEDAFGEDSAE